MKNGQRNPSDMQNPFAQAVLLQDLLDTTKLSDDVRGQIEGNYQTIKGNIETRMRLILQTHGQGPADLTKLAEMKIPEPIKNPELQKDIDAMLERLAGLKVSRWLVSPRERLMLTTRELGLGQEEPAPRVDQLLAERGSHENVKTMIGIVQGIANQPKIQNTSGLQDVWNTHVRMLQMPTLQTKGEVQADALIHTVARHIENLCLSAATLHSPEEKMAALMGAEEALRNLTRLSDKLDQLREMENEKISIPERVREEQKSRTKDRIGTLRDEIQQLHFQISQAKIQHAPLQGKKVSKAAGSKKNELVTGLEEKLATKERQLRAFERGDKQVEVISKLSELEEEIVSLRGEIQTLLTMLATPKPIDPSSESVTKRLEPLQLRNYGNLVDEHLQRMTELAIAKIAEGIVSVAEAEGDEAKQQLSNTVNEVQRMWASLDPNVLRKLQGRVFSICERALHRGAANANMIISRHDREARSISQLFAQNLNQVIDRILLARKELQLL